MLKNYFKPQSARADWALVQTMVDETGGTLWAAVPTDLVITITAYDRRGRQVFSTNTGDGTGQIAAVDNGVLDLNVPPLAMGAFCEPGPYDVRLKIETNGATDEFHFGRLNITEGL